MFRYKRGMQATVLYPVATSTLASPLNLTDRRVRYRRRRRSRSPEPQEDAAPSADLPHQEADARAQAHDATARWQRITELNARLTANLDTEARAIWMALEEALHVHWLDVAVDHYNRGYAAGRAQAWIDATLTDRTSPHEKLRAIALALAEVVESLERASAN
jgi:hypothetical protein